MEKNKASIFSEIGDFLKKDVSLSLSLGYILLISLGILFNYLYYSYFEIDILPYCDLTDFLVTPIREPLILVFFAGNLFFLYLIWLWDNFFQRRFPKTYRKLSLGINPDAPWHNAYKNTTFTVVLLIYMYQGIYILTRFEIRNLRMPDAPKVSIVIKDSNEHLISSTHVLVGKVGNYLIVKSDTARKRAIIFPMESIHSIRPVLRATKAKPDSGAK